MESLWFFFFREKAMSREDFVKDWPPSDRVISELVAENEDGNFDLLLKKRKFKDRAEIISYTEKMRVILQEKQ